MDHPHELIKNLTLEEKASLCSGKNFWLTKAVERLGIPSVMVADGPHGLRKQRDSVDQLGVKDSLPATCFPTAATTACSFDRELLYKVGRAIGEEANAERLAVVLGPGTNIKRSPLCGRNFEYFSEDPLLAGELAAALTSGIQSQGVGACLKHFACNNQEKARMVNDSIVDERALREIYLAPFEIAVKKAHPWTMMCAYNRINGVYASDNRSLLTDITRADWGFNGLIMSDWGAMNERPLALEAGLDLEMPYPGPYNDQAIVEAVKSGHLDESVLDQAVLRLLSLIQEYELNENTGQTYDLDAHDLLARQAASESAVLLKNQGMLPLSPSASLAVVGEFAQKPRYQGAGSSRINPHKITSALETLHAQGIQYDFAKGYDLAAKEDPEGLIAQAVELAQTKDFVLIFAGLPDAYESEGFDREHIDLPAEQNQLIERVAAVNPNVAVILHAGSAVRMPWLNRVKAVLMMTLGGQAVGAAAVDLIFGKVNPSGKLSETYSLDLAHIPSSFHFGRRFVSQYRESIFVGYRYFEKAGQAVLFPFGHGLSYTSFEYNDLKLSSSQISDDEGLSVSLKIRNSGSRPGCEVVQLYVAPPPSTFFKPLKELREFAKVHLEPGEEKAITFKLDKRAFAYWNVLIHDWHVESGLYGVQVGSSSQDIRLSAQVQVLSSASEVKVPDYQEVAPAYYQLSAPPADIPLVQFEALYGGKVPPDDQEPQTKFNLNSTLWDARNTLVGKYFIKTYTKSLRDMTAGSETDDKSFQRMLDSSLLETPFRAFTMMGVSREFVDGLILLLNNRFLKDIIKVVKNFPDLKQKN